MFGVCVLMGSLLFFQVPAKVDTEENNVASLTVGFIGTSLRRGPPFQHWRLGSALPIALQEPSLVLATNRSLKYVLAVDDCDPPLALDAIVRLVQEDHVDAIIGPACSGSADAAAYLAAAWNIPMIGYGGRSPILSDKNEFPTYLRSVSPIDLAGVVLAICRRNNWMTVGVLSLNTGQQYVVESLQNSLPLQNISVTVVASTPGSFFGLPEIATDARVIIFLGHDAYLGRFMEAAYDLGYVQSGEFAFILQDTRLEESAITMDWLYTGDEERDRKRAAAYEYAIHLTQMPYYLNDDYNEFLEDVRRRLIEPPFYSNLTSVSQVSPYAGFLYDAGMLYALVADAMIRDGADPTDGRAFLQYAQAVKFQGKSGSVSVDKNGDRKDDYVIYDFRNGTFERVAYYDGFHSEYVQEREMLWPGGVPPKDTPVCGFKAELCVKDATSDNMTSLLVGLTMGVALLFSAVAYAYRRRKAEAELMAANWMISYQELDFVKPLKLTSVASLATVGSEQNSIALGQNKNVALYKSTAVYVKRMDTTNFEWRKRAILLDLKQMRDARHDNLNVFSGACVEGPNSALVTTFCSRGGLDDVLANDDIQIDFLFKMSFAMDIAQGLQYLHKSDIKYHGRLKSSNCLVDGRWTIKLADYGLRNLLSAVKSPFQKEDEYDQCKHLQWTAPEILRTDDPWFNGSAKGDVYSYGIVLQEIVLRAPPFYPTDVTPQELIAKIKTPTGALLRPPLPKDSCPGSMEQLLQKCWSEQPADRPDIAYVTKELRQINGGKKINIMDQMVSMLEKYASNLEEIVNERTVQLAEEKRRTETLLFQMLPRTVANQLKNGKMVKAETFESATIFFSDIVGFTAMSSDSTPLQVVTLLNDLYTLFDDIIDEYSVYKVETIGDAYMVASGVPSRNGIKHAGEIATMSLDLLSATRTFRVRHMPDRKLMLRIGIHSGRCVAGVVGLKMPRYCLFGDTVNTASRMESNSQACRVHVSHAAKDLLDQLGGYTLVERGEVQMKGKGVQTTFWLTGKVGFIKTLPDLSELGELQELTGVELKQH